MAFRASDGKAFGNRQKMSAYNERLKNRDASDEREGREREEHGGSLEPKPNQPPEEVVTQNRRGENPARNPNPGPREPAPNTPTPGIEAAEDEAETPEAAAGADTDLSHMDINDVVRQHGPADSIQIRRSGGAHQVTTTHGGQRHVTSHPTPHSAALHAADSMGLNQQIAELAGNPQAEDKIPGIPSSSGNPNGNSDRMVRVPASGAAARARRREG